MSRRLEAIRARGRAWMGIVAVSIALTSCGDSNPSAPTNPEPSSSFAADVQPIFDAHCTSCHAIGVFGFNLTGGEEQNGLTLTINNSYDGLVNQPTFQRPDLAPTLRVDPGSPANSYLMQKIESDTPKVGERMPLSNPPLTAAQISIIRRWIERGAPND